MQLADHHSQQRQRVCSGWAVRLWRDLELCSQVAGGSGAALHRAGKPGMEGAGQPAHRKYGIALGPGGDLGGSVHDRAGQPVYEIASHHCGSHFQSGLSSPSLPTRNTACERERHGKPENLDQFRVYGNQELGSRRSECAPATFWSRSAIPRIFTICARSCAVPTPPGRTLSS